MRKIVILFLALVAILSFSLGYVYWPKLQYRYKKLTINKEEEAKDIKRASDLLKEGKPEEALGIIGEYGEDIDNHSDAGKEWLELLIRASEATGNVSQLVVLYEYYPKAFDSHEKAAMLVADYYLASGRSKDYQVLRDNWKGREAKPESWFVLDADKMLVEGKRKEAIEFLNSKSFQGKADTSRLVRLALLYVFEQPQKAWDYLTEAYHKDPKNPEIRSYRAKLLETVGKNNLALMEYVSAAQTDPKNLYLKDQLAEFYLRNRQYLVALQIWTENLKPPTLDFIWLKALFWSKVVYPFKFDLKENPPPKGKLEPLIKYLLNLKPDEFWNASAYESVPDGQQYFKSQQVTFWLRLLQLLKDGKEKEAASLLQFNPFQTVSWNPMLERILKSILLYRETGKFVAVTDENINLNSKEPPKPKQTAIPADTPYFFGQLIYLSDNPYIPEAGEKMPKDLKAILKSPDVFAAAFLNASWFEAALHLTKSDPIPDSYPVWYPYELIIALKQNQSNEAALEFAKKQKQVPAISLLTSELLIAGNQYDEALKKLEILSKEHDDVGYRASWLISLIYIDRGLWKEAKKVIEDQPELQKSVLGRETLARIALMQGDNDLADKLYRALEKESDEAKSYLARKAFTDKDWERARVLTEELLKKYPTSSLLQENYKKILEEQANEKEKTKK